MVIVSMGTDRATAAICAGFTTVAPITTNSPADAGMATSPIAPEKPTIITPISRPAITRARRVRAPAAASTRAPNIEPPTGRPRNSPGDEIAGPLPDEVA